MQKVISNKIIVTLVTQGLPSSPVLLRKFANILTSFERKSTGHGKLVSICQIAPSTGFSGGNYAVRRWKGPETFGPELEGTLGARGFSCAVYGFGQVKFTDQSISLR